MNSEHRNEYYQALLDKNSEYEGVFCRPTCPARKPKLAHCEFFKMAQEALLASFRPCKHCKPLSHPSQVSELIQILVQAVEENPEKRWKDRDFQQLSIDATISHADSLKSVLA